MPLFLLPLRTLNEVAREVCARSALLCWRSQRLCQNSRRLRQQSQTLRYWLARSASHTRPMHGHPSADRRDATEDAPFC
jgi:hypothetical protein